MRGQGGEEAPAQGERTWSKGKGKGREEEDWSHRAFFCSSGGRRRPVAVLGISGCVLMAWGHDRNSPWRHLCDGIQDPHFRGLLPLCPITCIHRPQRSNWWAARPTAVWVTRDLGRESGRGIRTRVVHERGIRYIGLWLLLRRPWIQLLLLVVNGLAQCHRTGASPLL